MVKIHGKVRRILPQEVNIIAGATVTNDGVIDIIGGSQVHLEIAPTDPSYELRFLGLQMDLTAEPQVAVPALERGMFVTRRLLGKDYRVLGIIAPGATRSTIVSVGPNAWDANKQGCLHALKLSQQSEGELAAAGVDPGIVLGSTSGTGITGAITGTEAMACFVEDPKGTNLTVIDRLAIQLQVGAPMEQTQKLYFAVQVVTL